MRPRARVETDWQADPRKRAVVLALLHFRRSGIPLRKAAGIARVHLATVCRWQVRDPSLRNALREAAVSHLGPARL